MPAPVTLYHAPPSFYSQIARLVLTEKGVSYAAKLALPGPPMFETYAPWYMALNPNGTVPTLVCGDPGVALPESREILSHVDASFPGPALTPAKVGARAHMEQRIAQLYAISMRNLTYGDENMIERGTKLNGMRLRHLRKRQGRNSSMAEVYAAKIRDIESMIEQTNDRAVVDDVRRSASATLDELEHSLREGGALASPFIAGETYSLADVVWTVAVARMKMLELEPLAQRPALAGWYARMQERPSFAEADIWEQGRPVAMVAMVARRFGLQVLVVLALIGVVLLLALRWS